MAYSLKQVDIRVCRGLLIPFQTTKKRFEIYPNSAKSPYTILIEVGKDFREHKELQRWDANWKALRDMKNPKWSPSTPIMEEGFMFDPKTEGFSIRGMAQEDLGHLLVLQDRYHLWGLKSFDWQITRMRNIIKELPHK